MPRYIEEIDDSEFLSPEILRIADTPSPVKPPPTASYAAALSTSDRPPPRTNLHSQFAAMQPHSAAASSRPLNPSSSSSSSSTASSSSQLAVPSSTFVPPSSSSSPARTSPYFARPAPLASAMDAPTLSDFFGDSPRGMTAIITRDSLSPQKQPTASQRQPASSLSAASSSSAASSVPQWRTKSTSSLPAASRVAAAPLSSSSMSRSDEVIDLAGDDADAGNRHITSSLPAAASSSAQSSLSSLTAHSEKQLHDLLQSPNKANSAKQKRNYNKPPRNLHITIQIVAPSTVGIMVQPEDQRVTDIVRNVSGSVWDEKGRMWTCRVSAVSALVSRFEAMGTEDSEVTVDAPDERLLADERRRETGRGAAGSEADDEKQELKSYSWMPRLPRKLARALYPFQRDGVDFALQHAGKVLIGDEMGLGKTLQGIAIASLYYDEWPCLIVCPSSLRLNWKNELTRWLPNINSREIQVIMSGKDRLLHRALHWNTRFTIISYDLVIKFEPSIKKAKYKVVICDESHYLKSLTAKRTKALLPILKQTAHCILLSGTPALSRPIELYNQISVLSDKFGSYHDFGLRYAKGRKGRFGWEYRGAANLTELHFLLKEHVMIRRLKEEVLTELRPKQRTAVMVTIDNAEVEAKCKRLTELKEMANSLVNTAESAAAPLSGFTQEKRNELFEMYRKSGEAKLSSIIQYISDLLENDIKFLVFAHHLSVLDGIEEFLKKNRYAYFRLDGSTTPTERQRGVDWFQSDANCKVALLSITAGGTGLTLTASSTVVFAELTFTPALLLQAEDRVHRIGQPNAVNIHYLLGRHSLDDLLWPLLVRKMAVVGSSLDGTEAELEFQGVRGDESEQDKARFNVGQKGMARWLEKEEQRKMDLVKREAAVRERRETQWRDAIEIGDEEEMAAEVIEGEGLSADREAELDEEAQDSMWVYVSDEDEKGFVVDDDEEEQQEGDDDDGEAEYKEEKAEKDEDELEDEDERFDSDEDYQQPDDEQADDDDDGEAEYQPKQSRGKKRVLRSDDEADDVDDDSEEADDTVKELLSNNSLTPLSSSSSVSSASASQSQWASTFGIDRRTLDHESRLAQVRLERQAARQKEMRKKQRKATVVEEVEEKEDDEQPYIRRKPSAASRLARDRQNGRGKEEQEEQQQEEEDVEVGDGGGVQYSESDMSVLLLGMGYSAGQVQSVLNELHDDTDEEQMYDVNTALETLIKQGHTQPAPQRTEERKEAAEDSDSVPCERCGELVSFYDYTTHLGQCRRAAANQTAARLNTSTEADKRSATVEEQKAAVANKSEEEENDEEEEEEEEAEVEEQVRVKPAADRRRRIIDLEDEEEVEELIVNSQEKRSTDDDVSVDDEVNVEWVDE